MNISPSTLVVCHDAGGAQIVAAYIAESTDQSQFVCCVAGPAIAVFQRFHIPVEIIHENESSEKIFVDHPTIRKLLAGSSWSTTLELDCIAVAKRKKIHTIVYLDHWLNFRERFGFPHPNWSSRLPDEFWVGDKHAYVEAVKFFPDKTIVVEPNRYFNHLKLQAAVASKLHPVELNRLLWISEPFSEPVNPFGDTAHYVITEHQTLSILGSILSTLPLSLHLVIRLHPSELPHKYDSELESFPKNVSHSISREPDLLVDIAKAHWVVGLESIAMVIAMLVGKPVASFVPSVSYHCLLPFPAIKKFHTATELEGFLTK